MADTLLVRRHLRRVRVSTHYGVLEISLDSRDLLLEEIQQLDSASDVVSAFDVADGHPVTLDPGGKALVIAAVARMGQDGGGMSYKPNDLTELRSLFAAELDQLQARRTEPVTIMLRRDVVVISGEERTDLLAHMAAHPSARHVIEKFRALGASSRVAFSRDEARELYTHLLDWVGEVGYDQLPSGVRNLTDALAEEVGLRGPGIRFMTSADP